MRILLTNDDGIHADGLAALERIAEQLSDDVWVCAPEYEQSGAQTHTSSESCSAIRSSAASPSAWMPSSLVNKIRI